MGNHDEQPENHRNRQKLAYPVGKAPKDPEKHRKTQKARKDPEKHRKPQKSTERPRKLPKDPENHETGVRIGPISRRLLFRVSRCFRSALPVLVILQLIRQFAGGFSDFLGASVGFWVFR